MEESKELQGAYKIFRTVVYVSVLVENKYSVNVPMRYYYKGKFRKGEGGGVNIVNSS